MLEGLPTLASVLEAHGLAGIAEENLVIEMKDDVSQVVVRPEKDASFRAIIMPMRIL